MCRRSAASKPTPASLDGKLSEVNLRLQALTASAEALSSRALLCQIAALPATLSAVALLLVWGSFLLSSILGGVAILLVATGAFFKTLAARRAGKKEAVQRERASLLVRCKMELPMHEAIPLLVKHDPTGDHRVLADIPPDVHNELRRLREALHNVTILADGSLELLVKALGPDQAAAAMVPAQRLLSVVSEMVPSARRVLEAMPATSSRPQGGESEGRAEVKRGRASSLSAPVAGVRRRKVSGSPQGEGAKEEEEDVSPPPTE